MSPEHNRPLTFDSDPLSVTNFVDRMHGECADMQWLRELVVNSIEAIHATGEGGSIFVHAVDQDMGEGIGTVKKLAVTDTGEGIAQDSLYSSFQVAMTSRGAGNYGIGAKIAALPLNNAGMIYRSLVTGGDVAELMWHRTSKHGHYAAFGLEDEESGEPRFVTPPSAEAETYSRLTDAGRGTQVVLCGANPQDETCRTLYSSAKSHGNLHWAIRELNFKFWHIPKNIEVRVENVKRDRGSGGPRDYTIRGGQRAMSGFATRYGTVSLVEFPFKVHWFLLRKDVAKRNSQNGWCEGRIIGTLFREPTGVVEVYARRRTRQAATLMNDFGIYTGADRVVLLIEPNRQQSMQPTTARNDLRIEGDTTVSGLYKQIGQEFASLMAEQAPALAMYVREQLDGIESTSDKDKLKEAIARAIELYGIADFRRLAKGADKVSNGAAHQPVEEKRLQEDDQLQPDLDPPDPMPPVPRPTPPRPRPRPRPRPLPNPSGEHHGQRTPPTVEPKTFTWGPLSPDDVTDYSTNTQQIVMVNTEGETYLRLLAMYKGRPDFEMHHDQVQAVVRRRCEASLQLSIFTLEREFDVRSGRLGMDFEAFFNKNLGRVCLDAMASKDVHTATVREIKNLIAKNRSAAVAEATFAPD